MNKKLYLEDGELEFIFNTIDENISGLQPIIIDRGDYKSVLYTIQYINDILNALYEELSFIVEETDISEEDYYVFTNKIKELDITMRNLDMLQSKVRSIAI